MEDGVSPNRADSVGSVQNDPTKADKDSILSQNSLDDAPLDVHSLNRSDQTESSDPSIIAETSADPGTNATTTQLPVLAISQPLSVSSDDDDSTELYDLGNSILDECMRAAPLGELETTILQFREALGRRPGLHPLHSDSRSNLARALMTRFSYMNQQQDLGEALMMLGGVMPQSQSEIENTVQPRNDLQDDSEASEMTNVAKSTLTSFNSSTQLSSLDTAIKHHRNALELRPSPHPGRLSSLDSLARGLYAKFRHTGNIADLDEGISLLGNAVGSCAELEAGRPRLVGTLSAMLGSRFDQTGQPEDLQEAMRLYYADDTETIDCPDTNAMFHSAKNLLKQFQRSGEMSDVETAILLFREVLASTQRCAIVLHELATALHKRFGQASQGLDLDEAISLHREALALRPSPHPHHSNSLNKLANTLSTRFGQLGQQKDLEEAVFLHQKALALRPSPHPDRSMSLNNLAIVLGKRFGQLGQREDLDEAISLNREALALFPSPHPDRCSSLNNLATLLMTRFRQSGQREDLDEAISLGRETLALLPSPHPDCSISLNNLANVLQTRFSQSGQREELDEATSLHREALAMWPSPHPDRHISLNDLANVLNTRFSESGQREDLDDAISLHRETLALLPTCHPGRSNSLSNLGNVLNTRFGQSGQWEGLDEAISLHREALALFPSSHPCCSGRLNNLANALYTRFGQSGQREDLDEAISLHREALLLRPNPHPDRLSSLNNLAKVLRRRFGQSGRREDIDEVISLSRERLALRPSPYPRHPRSLDNLASVLQTRFGQSGQWEDLDEAISLHREALGLRPSPHPDRSISLSKLANVLDTRFSQSVQQEDLEEAIAMFNVSLVALPNDHPGKCTILNHLGRTPLVAYSHTHKSHYLAEAMTAFRTALQCEAAPVSKRFHVAKSWAQHAESHHDPSALEAYRAAIGLLPRLAMLGLDLRSRHQALMSGTDGLARNAAACAIRSGQYGAAIELLEEGRAIFWSQALQLRTPVDDLRVVAPQLAQSLTEISFQLEQGSVMDKFKDISDSSQYKISRNRKVLHFRRLNEQWLAKVEEVRKLDGFHDFLRPIRLAALQRAVTCSSPIVILNASDTGCAALVLTRSETEPVQFVPLRKITLVRAQALTRILQIAVSLGRDRSIPIQDLIRLHADSEDLGEEMLTLADILRSFEGLDEGRGTHVVTDARDDFKSLLHFLWLSVVHPVICSLGLEKSENVKLLPHIRWCPTGPFAFLPIHAAGIHNLGNSEGIFDYAVSSYTPTISALLRPTPSVPTSFKMLVVIESQSLKYTKDELQKIEDRVPDECLVKLDVSGSPASVEAVMSSLRDVSVAHFACHGVQDEANPLDSALILEDGRLKVSRIMGQSMSGASLAFLSACQTAKGDGRLPDEAMHLAATLLFAGFRGVVGTMWSIYDKDGPKVADSFYEELFPAKNSGVDLQRAHPDTTEAARALHVSVGKLRAEGVSFERWVPFIHLGI